SNQLDSLKLCHQEPLGPQWVETTQRLPPAIRTMQVCCWHAASRDEARSDATGLVTAVGCGLTGSIFASVVARGTLAFQLRELSSQRRPVRSSRSRAET